jgi:hypothetical protein
VRRVRKRTKDRGIWVMDRGEDRNELMHPFLDDKMLFLIRQRGDRPGLGSRLPRGGAVGRGFKTPHPATPRPDRCEIPPRAGFVVYDFRHYAAADGIKSDLEGCQLPLPFLPDRPPADPEFMLPL